MSTRQEKFEAERNKMLSEMGKSEKIKLEPEEEENIDSNEMIENNDERFNKAMQKIDNDITEIKDMTKNPEKRMIKLIQEKRNKTKPGVLQNAIDTNGNNIMIVATIFIVLPVSLIYWHSTNLISAIVVFAFTWFVIRVPLFALSLAVFPSMLEKSQDHISNHKSLTTTASSSFIKIVSIITLVSFVVLSFGLHRHPISLLYKEGIITGIFFILISGLMGVLIWFIVYMTSIIADSAKK